MTKIKNAHFLLIASVLLLGGNIYSIPPLKGADQGISAPIPIDPKKKKAGDECKASTECQRHHTCEKTGAKRVCVAPPRHEIPNT